MTTEDEAAISAEMDRLTNEVFSLLIVHGMAITGSVLTMCMAKLMGAIPADARKDALNAHANMALGLSHHFEAEWTEETMQ